TSWSESSALRPRFATRYERLQTSVLPDLIRPQRQRVRPPEPGPAGSDDEENLAKRVLPRKEQRRAKRRANQLEERTHPPAREGIAPRILPLQRLLTPHHTSDEPHEVWSLKASGRDVMLDLEVVGQCGRETGSGEPMPYLDVASAHHRAPGPVGDQIFGGRPDGAGIGDAAEPQSRADRRRKEGRRGPEDVPPIEVIV